MSENNANTEASKQLQSRQRDLLDRIDLLRSQGVESIIDLPLLVVCGDQSSGKSSVLEAISRVRFPAKESLCTRFATELVLRRADDTTFSVSIIPGTSRTLAEIKALENFQSVHADLAEFARILKEAGEAMGLSSSSSSKNYFEDILRVEISGPNQPHLTLVDLPGLIHSGNKEDIQLVDAIMEKYASKRRSVILAVVAAKPDFELQVIFHFLKGQDPNGQRTLGIITKVDELRPGSESERKCLRLANNETVKTGFGWHVLVNRDFQHQHFTDQERDAREAEALSRSVWSGIPSSSKCAPTLRRRLSSILLDRILEKLPQLLFWQYWFSIFFKTCIRIWKRRSD